MTKLHITKGSGKMKDIYSINTPSSTNPFCKKMSKTNSICASCYAIRNESFRKNLIPAFERNVKILLSPDYVPEIVPYKVMRFHSYGELHNGVHFRNFVKLAFVNPGTFFTLWTKRAKIVQNYVASGGIIPSNLNLIYSNPIVDCERTRVPKHFDKVFNVHTTKGIKAHNIDINCGSKDCGSCMLCYSKNSVTIVNEKRK